MGSALLDMHSKLGNIDKARQVFDKMQVKDVVAWNSMISGLAINVCAEESLRENERIPVETR